MDENLGKILNLRNNNEEKANHDDFSDILSFRTMVSPILIQIFFWLDILGCIVIGLYMIGDKTQAHIRVIGFTVLLIGPIISRVVCESAIILFRIYEVLKEIKAKTK